MTRPHKPDGEKRTLKLEVRVTPAEKNHILQLAREYGLNASDFLRVRAISAEPVRRKPTPERATLLALLAEAGKQGSNLNQIARAINRREQTGELIGVAPETIEHALREVEGLAKLLQGILQHGYHG